MLLNASRERLRLLAIHMGEPQSQIPSAIAVFTLYAPFSFVGFLLIGIPAVLLLPVRSITRWSWLLVLAVGASLGPVALAVILLFLRAGFAAGEIWLFIFSVLVSAVGFTGYVALLRRHLRRDN